MRFGMSFLPLFFFMLRQLAFLTECHVKIRIHAASLEQVCWFPLGVVEEDYPPVRLGHRGLLSQRPYGGRDVVTIRVDLVDSVRDNDLTNISIFRPLHSFQQAALTASGYDTGLLMFRVVFLTMTPKPLAFIRS